MTAPTLLPDPDATAGVVTYTVDAQAEPGRVVETLAALLINLARRRQQAEQQAADVEGRTNG